MDIKKLKDFTKMLLLSLEERDSYDPEIPIEMVFKRKYNTIRTLEDYIHKFPNLGQLLKDNIRLLEIGAGDGIAFKQIKESYKLEAVATNIASQKNNTFSLVATASDLPFSDNYFDLIIGIQSITWEPNQKKQFRK